MRSLRFSFLLLACWTASLSAQTVRFHTNLGDIDVNMAPASATLTVANFLNYLNKGLYTNSIVHRSVRTGISIFQGGGYQLINHSRVPVPQYSPVTNEFKISNTRGTIAMAKTASDPNSATSQWFFNVADNSANLDTQNSGFTAFGQVADDASLAVVDKILALPIYSIGAPFDSIPLVGFAGGVVIPDADYVLVSSVQVIPAPVTSSLADAASYQANATAGIAPGELVVVFGTGIGAAQLTTLKLDSNGLVSNSLGGTRVLFDGVPAPVLYTSPNQVSVVAPLGLAGKSSTVIVVENQGVPVSTVTLNVVAANPGIFTLDASGKGDAAVVRTDGSVVNTAAPAKAGDVVLLYGEGYGVSAPALADGAIVGSTLPLPAGAISLLIDGKSVPVLYAGGAPGIVNGVLQVNFSVPAGLAPGGHSIQLQVGSQISPSGVNFQTK